MLPERSAPGRPCVRRGGPRRPAQFGDCFAVELDHAGWQAGRNNGSNSYCNLAGRVGRTIRALVFAAPCRRWLQLELSFWRRLVPGSPGRSTSAVTNSCRRSQDRLGAAHRRPGRRGGRCPLGPHRLRQPGHGHQPGPAATTSLSINAGRRHRKCARASVGCLLAWLDRSWRRSVCFLRAARHRLRGRR